METISCHVCCPAVIKSFLTPPKQHTHTHTHLFFLKCLNLNLYTIPTPRPKKKKKSKFLQYFHQPLPKKKSFYRCPLVPGSFIADMAWTDRSCTHTAENACFPQLITTSIKAFAGLGAHWRGSQAKNEETRSLKENKLQKTRTCKYGCFQKLGYPKMDGLYWKALLKWMIWGYHLFLETPILKQQCAAMQIVQSVNSNPSPLVLFFQNMYQLYSSSSYLQSWVDCWMGGTFHSFARHASWKNIMASFLLPTAAAAMAIFPETVMPSGLCRWWCFLTTLRQGSSIWKRPKSWPPPETQHVPLPEIRLCERLLMDNAD